MVNLKHMESLFSAQARIRLDARFRKYEPCVLAGNGVVVHHENGQVLRLDFPYGGESVFAFPESHNHGEGGTHPFLRFYRNGAIHHLYDVLGNRHSKPGTAELRAPRGIFLREGVKYLRDEGF